MMKRLFIFILVGFASVSCRHKELWYGDPDDDRQPVNVVFKWAADAVKPSSGMRVNLFSLNAMPDYGRIDMNVNGGTVRLPYGGNHIGLCYNYNGNQMLFSDQDNRQQIRVSCAKLSRATYSRAYPDEATHIQPDADIWTDRLEGFAVVASETPLEMVYYPANVVKTYTFELANVVGAEFITDVRGAISGMSNGYYFDSQTYFTEPVTVFFTGKADKAGKRITGSFRTFCRQDITNIFTIEILFPSSDGRIIQKSYDVTPQIEPAGSYHIYIADSGIEVPDESGGGTGGWGVDVKDWDRVPVPL